MPVLIAQQRKRKMKPFDRLSLVFCVLRTQAEEVKDTRIGYFPVVVSKRTRLRRTPARTRYRIPILRNRLVRLTHPGIAIDHGPTTSLSQVYRES